MKRLREGFKSPPPRLKRLRSDVGMRLRALQGVSGFSQAVEELVHNALDADALHILVRVDPTQFKLCVQDDGVGLTLEALKKVGEVLSTSKLGAFAQKRLLEDGVVPSGSFGFRGEAIQAMSFIGKVEFRSRVRGCSGNGYLKVIQDGKCKELRELRNDERVSAGTSVCVSEVFGKTPVRQKILLESKAREELLLTVKKMLQRCAVGTPKVNFVLSRNYSSNPEWEFNREGECHSTREAFSALFGAEIGEKLVDVSIERKNLRIDALVSPMKVESMHNSSFMQFTFINGRPFPSIPRIEKHVNRIYRKCFERQHVSLASLRNTFPAFVLSIECPDDKFDLLLDPKKLMVEFNDWHAVFQGLDGLLFDLLQESYTQYVEAAFKQEQSRLMVNNECTQDSTSTYFSEEPIQTSELSRDSDLWRAFNPKKRGFWVRTDPNVQNESQQVGLSLSRKFLQEAKVVSQVGSKFIFAQCGSQIICVDQHAADERIRLERFEASILGNRKGSVLTSQLLETPELLELNVEQALHLEDLQPKLESWCFSLKRLNEKQFMMTAVPNVFGHKLTANDLIEMIEFAKECPSLLSLSIPPPIRRTIITRACRGAIMFGDELNHSQCVKLIKDLAKCKFPFQCAHGRPSVCPVASFSEWIPEREIRRV